MGPLSSPSARPMKHKVDELEGSGAGREMTMGILPVELVRALSDDGGVVRGGDSRRGETLGTEGKAEGDQGGDGLRSEERRPVCAYVQFSRVRILMSSCAREGFPAFATMTLLVPFSLHWSTKNRRTLFRDEFKLCMSTSGYSVPI